MLPVSRAHAVEEDEVKKMDSKLNRIKIRGLRLDFINALFEALAYVSFQIFRVSCLVVTGYLAYTGKITEQSRPENIQKIPFCCSAEYCSFLRFCPGEYHFRYQQCK